MEFYSCWWENPSFSLSFSPSWKRELMRLAAASNKSLRDSEPATAPREFTLCQNCNFPRFRRSQLAIGLLYLDHCTAQILRNSPVNEMMHDSKTNSRRFQLSTFSSTNLESLCSLRKKRNLYECTHNYSQLFADYARGYWSIKSIACWFTPDLFIRSTDRWAWKTA